MAIKSFQGARAKTTGKKEYDAAILVSDYMTKKLITFSPDQSILEVMEAFAKHHISGGPVLDDNGFLVGIISEAEINHIICTVFIILRCINGFFN